MPYIGNQPGTGVRSRFIYTATASQTTFSGADDNSKTLKYADSNYIDVYLNGVCLEPGTDYTASTKTSVVLTQAASLGDTLKVIAYDVASMDDSISQSAGGTFEAPVTIRTSDNNTQLTLESTDADATFGPVLDLHRNSSSPADADATGRINFKAENDAGETITYAQAFSSILDVTDGTEDGRYKIGTMVAGSFDSRMDMTNTETVFNEDSKDLDFRVESDGNANMFVVDAGNNIIGIGRTPDSNDGGAGSLQLEGADGMAMRRPSQTNSFILRPLASGDGMRFTQGGTGDRVTIDSSGKVGIGNTAPAEELVVQGAINQECEIMLRTAGGVNCSIFTAAPTSTHDFGIKTNGTEHFRVANNGDLTATDTSIGSNSDERLKKDITDFEYDLATFKKYKAKKFNWKQPQYHGDRENQIGFIAQELSDVDSQWVSTRTLPSVDLEEHPEAQYLDEDLSVFTSKLGQTDAMYISVIQQLISKIETLETKVAALEAE